MKPLTQRQKEALIFLYKKPLYREMWHKCPIQNKTADGLVMRGLISFALTIPEDGVGSWCELTEEGIAFTRALVTPKAPLPDFWYNVVTTDDEGVEKLKLSCVPREAAVQCAKDLKNIPCIVRIVINETDCRITHPDFSPEPKLVEVIKGT